jgi:hypothetical protein
MRQRSEGEHEPGELFRPSKPAEQKSESAQGERTTLVPALKAPDVPPQAETKSTPLPRAPQKAPDGSGDAAPTGSPTSASRSG